MKIRAVDGCEELGHQEMLSTPLFYIAGPGDKLVLLDNTYKFNVATYRPDVEPRWIYTYTYAPDQSWTIYNHDLSGDTYRQEDYTFSNSLYFRVCLRKVSGDVFDGAENINDILELHTEPEPEKECPSRISTEAGHVLHRVREISEPGDKKFILMTDTHYNVNGTWGDTLNALNQISREIEFDGLIHLGDMTDGMVTGDATRHYVKKIMSDISQLGIPVWMTLGNHDANYFNNNPERFSIKQQRELYYNGNEMRYHVDIPGLRLIFLDSFDPDEELRYGHSRECILWLEQVLDKTPDSSNIIIFSHMPPLTRLQFWAKEIRGEKEITEVLNRYRNKLIAWINGHNHADKLDNDEGYPIISIVNAKCEAFTEHKTEGFITPDRKLDDITQEAFDILIVNTEKKKTRFIRFGAGGDRIVTNGKALWV